MECRTTGNQVLLNEVILETAVEQPVDTEFTMPDYCPDIGKILKCCARPHILSRTVRSDGVTLEGNVRLTVIYLDGRDKRVFSCEHDQPFTVSVPIKDCPENARAAVTLRVDYMNCRATSQRRVDIHGAFTANVKVTAPQMCEMIAEAEGAGVRLRQTNREVSSFVGSSQSQFTISEALDLADGKPPIASVISADAVMCAHETKAIANKLIVKGDALLRIVYRTDSGERLEVMEYALPYNQFFDLTGADDSCVCDVSLEAANVDIGLRTDSDGEYRRMTADIKAFADIRAYRPMEICAVTDAYSVECELNVERKNVAFEKICAAVNERCSCQSSIELSDRAISMIDDVWACVSDVSAATRDGRIEISGKLTVSVIATDTQGVCDYYERAREFSCSVAAPDKCENNRVGARVQLCGISYSLVEENKLDLRCELEADAIIFEDVRLSCVCAITPDEQRRKNTDSAPAVVLYFADAGEELWDIARDHNSSVENIMAENGLSDEVLSESRQLLITV